MDSFRSSWVRFPRLSVLALAAGIFAAGTLTEMPLLHAQDSSGTQDGSTASPTPGGGFRGRGRNNFSQQNNQQLQHTPAAANQNQTRPTPILPPIQPTSVPQAPPPPLHETPFVPPVAAKSVPHRATVTYAAGLLDVRANDSSLNQILRQISRATGMTITGGVVEDRVFGNYGPAEPATILATLLDGTGSNMLLRESANNVPAELVLTPRSGGVTPPNPNSPGFDDSSNDREHDDERRPDQPSPSVSNVPNQDQRPTSGSPSIPQPGNNVNGSEFNTSPTASTLPVTNSVPTDSVPTPSTTPSSNGIVDAPNPPAPDSTTGTTPGGAATPESIYQQLKALQAAQQNKSSSPSTTTTTPQ